MQHGVRPKLAINAYIQGSKYHNVVDLSRKYEPGEVVNFQKKWGDYLFRIESKADEVIEHCMEAHAYIHTFEAVSKCNRLSPASLLINELDCSEAHT